MKRFAPVCGLLLTLLVVGPAQAQSTPPYSQPAEFRTALRTPDQWASPSRIVEVPDEPLLPLRRGKRSIRWMGGHEFGWLRPRLSDNVSVVVTQPTGNQAYSFDHSFELTSRIWAGIENANCNGLRAGYWYFEADAPTQVNFATAGATPLFLTIQGAGGNLSRTAVANVGDAMTSDNHLEMRTIDIEATHRLQYSRTSALAFFGLRYAKVEQRTHAVATDGGGLLTELVCQDLEFDGFGPTLGVDVTRQLFPCRPLLSRLSFYGNTRGSLMIGTQQQEIVLVTGGGASLAEDYHSQDIVLPILEISGGLQLLTRPFGLGWWTIRTGYRAESWFGAGGAVTPDGNLGVHGVVLSIAGQW